ncbi:MAG: riboflavin synthase [Candidatus Pelagibacter sp. TMED118]|nr:MAG: riboflavin synthase [Candidatus Pelagibacter sp. TMED118]|tara:strand:- start:1728 stop:2327 length:600 start_codon:yes stop_codon:yes gene_type:complete
MFNGIIYSTGLINKIQKRPSGSNIYIKSNLRILKKDLGMSIACDGVCLTLISVNNKILEFFLSKETISRSNFKISTINKKINLETPLKYGQKISGHICQGHVDTTAKLKKITKADKAFIYKFKINSKFHRDLVEKASILINGVSLTISKVYKNYFEIWIIPHTLKLTNLSKLRINDLVNIEIDILSKYVKKFINEKKKI